MPYRSFRQLMRNLSQTLPNNPFPSDQEFDTEYNQWKRWALFHVEVGENDPISPSYFGDRESQPVSELQRYQAEYFMWRAHYRHLDAFPSINPQGSWLPDNDAHQSGANTPIPSQRYRLVARKNPQSTFNTPMDATKNLLQSLESRIEALELALGRPAPGQHHSIMVNRNMLERSNTFFRSCFTDSLSKPGIIRNDFDKLSTSK
ncbi:hypothetical protein N431DRAFT_444422 [Stipitochalara longipes BDJ]|nr:hypothetical protein N431DRAFT_444422 [Stipitochalara longipes BDJ]